MLRTSVSVCALITVLASSSAVLAQDPSLAGARAALAAYDLEGPATLNALADLGPIAARGGAPAVEARYLRAIAGADLYTLSIVLPDDALGARLADALGVPASDVSAHLRSELSATGRGPYRRSAVDELQLLDAVSAFERGDLASIALTHGARSDALTVLCLAMMISTSGALDAIPGATAPRFPADRDVSAGLAAIQAAGVAHRRAMDAARLGDPWMARLAPRLTSALAALEARSFRPRVTLPAALVAPIDQPSTSPVDVLIAFDASAVSLGCSPHASVPDAVTVVLGTVSPGGHCAALPEVQRIALGAVPVVPRAIDALTSALTAAEIAGATSIALAPAVDAPLHVLVRTLLSLEAAHVSATHVALRGSDGGLLAIPVQFVHRAALGPMELTVNLRLGGYEVTRGRGRAVSLPRIRGAHGLEFDRTGLARTLRERPPSTAAIDGMTNVPASEIAMAARLASESGARVTIVLP